MRVEDGIEFQTSKSRVPVSQQAEKLVAALKTGPVVATQAEYMALRRGMADTIKAHKEQTGRPLFRYHKHPTAEGEFVVWMDGTPTVRQALQYA